MKITVKIDDGLMKRAKKRAADEGRTLTSLVEEGLTFILSNPKTNRRKRVELPVFTASVGTLPGVDLNRASDLEEVMNTP